MTGTQGRSPYLPLMEPGAALVELVAATTLVLGIAAALDRLAWLWRFTEDCDGGSALRCNGALLSTYFLLSSPFWVLTLYHRRRRGRSGRESARATGPAVRLPDRR